MLICIFFLNCIMDCNNVVKTKTGTFTFFHDLLPVCEAKLKCFERGEILAPVTNKRDANKVVKLFNDNLDEENCTFNTYYGISYWTGLDITYNDNEQKRVISNGIRWNEKKHGKIYRDYIKEEHISCPRVLFEPHYTSKPFKLTGQRGGVKKVNRYICLKPKVKQSAESIVQGDESMKSETFLPTVFVVAALAVLMNVVGIFAFVRVHKKNKRLAKELQSFKVVQAFLKESRKI